MQFEPGHLYHVYNRGNNSEKVFFTRANYLFFLEKIKKHVLSHADILAWCLMPSHFHLMIHVNRVEIGRTERVTGGAEVTQRVTPEHAITQRVTTLNQSNEYPELPTLNENSHPLSSKPQVRSLNDSFAIVLRTYTRAIQRQEHRTGSLFQERTKASCLTQSDGITPSWFQTSFGVIINIVPPEREYPQVCFNYIHCNPVKDRLVKLPEEWEFSSARDYAGLRNGKLIRKERADEFGLVY